MQTWVRTDIKRLVAELENLHLNDTLITYSRTARLSTTGDATEAISNATPIAPQLPMPTYAGTTHVPALPSSASPMQEGSVMSACGPPRSRKLTTASILGAMLPGAKWPSAR